MINHTIDPVDSEMTEYLDRLESAIRRQHDKESAPHFEIDSSESDASVYRVWLHRAQNPGKVIGVFYRLNDGTWQANAFDTSSGYTELGKYEIFATSDEAIAHIKRPYLG